MLGQLVNQKKEGRGEKEGERETDRQTNGETHCGDLARGTGRWTVGDLGGGMGGGPLVSTCSAFTTDLTWWSLSCARCLAVISCPDEGIEGVVGGGVKGEPFSGGEVWWGGEAEGGSLLGVEELGGGAGLSGVWRDPRTEMRLLRALILAKFSGSAMTVLVTAGVHRDKETSESWHRRYSMTFFCSIWSASIGDGHVH